MTEKRRSLRRAFRKFRSGHEKYRFGIDFPRALARLSESHGVLIDYELATIVAALAAYVVIHMPCTAVGADGESGDKSLVVCATFRSSGMRLSSFGMCHFLCAFNCFYLLVASCMGRISEISLRRPARWDQSHRHRHSRRHLHHRLRHCQKRPNDVC